MIATQMPTLPVFRQSSREDGICILCLRCRRPLASASSAPALGSASFRCSHCDTFTHSEDGIWHAITTDRLEYFRQFKTDYELIRSAEGRGCEDPDYYLALPFRDVSRRNSAQWRIRSASFRYIERHILSPLAATQSQPLRVLDLGAGNGWMSYRMALRGYSPVAVDLLVNDQDGLGAAAHYRLKLHCLFPRVQAELDRLPFPADVSDVTLYNASLHYSENYERTLAEALRCTRSGGLLVVSDTPLYENEDSGRRMVEEKHKHFLAKYGVQSNSIAALEYLTPQRLDRLQSSLDLEWKQHRPSYGLRWALRPLRAKLRGDRPPSSFRIFTAVVNK
jgi:SAM-dependent methyltransferase